MLRSWPFFRVAQDRMPSGMPASKQMMKHDPLNDPDGSLSRGKMRSVFEGMGERKHRHRGYRLGMRLLSGKRPSGTPSGTNSLSLGCRTRGRNGDSTSHISERSSRSIWCPHSCHTIQGPTLGWPGASPGARTSRRMSRRNAWSTGHSSCHRTAASTGLSLSSLLVLPCPEQQAIINTSYCCLLRGVPGRA